MYIISLGLCMHATMHVCVYACIYCKICLEKIRTLHTVIAHHWMNKHLGYVYIGLGVIAHDYVYKQCVACAET